MTDRSTPKGPLLPGSGQLDPSKTGNKVIPIGSEKVTDSPKVKEKKRAHRQARDKRNASKKAFKTTPPEKVTAEATQKTLEKKAKETHNDERLKKKNRDGQQRLVKFRAETLPKRSNSAGNNLTQLPRHPLTIKMTGDPNVAADTVVNERSRNELQLKHQHQHQHQHQATHSKTLPTPKPPGM